MRISDAHSALDPRRLIDRFRFERFRRRHRPVGVPSLGVASGKGGTGKTFVTINLGVQLARSFGGVQVFDADLGLGNAHVLLGLRPVRNLQQYFDGDCGLDELVLGSPYDLRLLPGGSGISRLAHLSSLELRRMAQDLLPIVGRSHAVLVDSAAGIAPQTLLFLRCTDYVLIVVTPELTSLTDAYALIKCLVLRRQETRFVVVVNRADDEDQAREVFEKLQEVSGRFLSIPLHYLGGVPEDRAARAALAAKVPIVVRAPQSPAGRALRAAGVELERVLRMPRQDATDFSSRLLDIL